MKKRLHDRKRLLQFALSLCLIFVSANVSWGQLHTDITPGGIEQYIVPAGVTSITISTWGAGGAGGSVKSNTSGQHMRGGGGAGGSYATTILSVTPGDFINYTVGAGGTGLGLGFANGTASGEGGFSSANKNGGSDVVKALGGPGGISATGIATVNGAGGTAAITGNTGDSFFWGGNGGTSATGGSGGGGSSAGTASHGINGFGGATGFAGGNAVTGGGAGGAGSNNNNVATAGTAGSILGGGGGGASSRGTATSYAAGGSGANGKIVITNNGVPSTSASTTAMSGFTGTTAQSFTVTGANLTSALFVKANSTDYELSTDPAFTSPAGEASINLGLIPTNPTTIYVRLKSGLGGGVKTATLTVETSSATTLNVVCTGGVSATYYYGGSGVLSAATSWGTNTDGSGVNPTAVTDGYSTFVLSNAASVSTDSAWTLGTNSKVIVGNGSAVTLTVADASPITGTIDAAASGSIVWQHVATSPTFGTLDNASEVHLQPATAASYSFGATTAYGKLFIDGLGEVSVSNTASTPTVKTALTVASGSTLSFTSNNNPTISVNAEATATINGTVKTSKPAGLFATTGSIPLIGAATLVLGTTSTIEFSRSGSAQPVTPLPFGVSYANLILSDGTGGGKTIADEFKVNGTLTINLFTSSVVTGANLITLANGATVVMTSGVLDVAPAFGTTVNVTYNGRAAQTAGVEIPISGLKILTINNIVSVTFNNLTIEPGASTNVLKGSLIVTGALINNGSLTIENKSNLVQPTNASTFVQNSSASSIVKRSSSTLFRSDYTLWSSPVASQNLLAFSPATTPTRFYNYNTATNQYNAEETPGTTPFTVGKGYLIRMPNTDLLAGYDAGTVGLKYPGVFTGVPNNGEINVPITAGATGLRYNLVGNPYPSPITMSTFVSENGDYIESTLYFWRKTNGVPNTTGSAYCTWNAGTYAGNGNAQSFDPTGVIQTGQGFFVEAKPGATSLTFNNTQRVSNTANQFFRTNLVAEPSKIWLNATNAAGNFSQMAVTYFDGATIGVDAFDAKYINDSNYALTSSINDAEYTIQGRPAFDVSDVVVLNFKTTVAGNYTIAIDHVEGLFSTGQTVFLKDNLLNTVVDLSAGGYSFASTIGTFNSRFEVVYQNTLAVTNPTFTANSVIAYSANGEIRINSGSTIMELVRVYDLQGRLLVEKKQINASETKLSTTATNQVLLVEITAANGSKITKKIIQ